LECLDHTLNIPELARDAPNYVSQRSSTANLPAVSQYWSVTGLRKAKVVASRLQVVHLV